MTVRKVVQKIDRRMPWPGWKGALLGLVAAFFPMANEWIVYLGGTPLPPELVVKTQSFLGVGIGLALILKAVRE